MSSSSSLFAFLIPHRSLGSCCPFSPPPAYISTALSLKSLLSTRVEKAIVSVPRHLAHRSQSCNRMDTQTHSLSTSSESFHHAPEKEAFGTESAIRLHASFFGTCHGGAGASWSRVLSKWSRERAFAQATEHATNQCCPPLPLSTQRVKQLLTISSAPHPENPRVERNMTANCHSYPFI